MCNCACPLCRSCSLQQVIEALMPNRCQEFMSLERLEILGDAVLKFHASWHLYSANPRAHEGQSFWHSGLGLEGSGLVCLSVCHRDEVLMRSEHH